MPFETKAYQCNFCRKVSRTRAGAERHENACKWNPARRSCHTCKHCEMKANIPVAVSDEEKAFYEEVGAVVEDYATIRGMYCKHFNKPVSEKPYFEECDIYDDTYTDERPMPGTCWHYEPREVNDG